MGMYSDWVTRKTGASDKQAVNVEFVLKEIDKGNNNISNITLTDAAESNTLPATASTPLQTLLQTIRNNLRWLFNISNILKQVYPVGSIYMTVNNTNPAIWISGTTWTAWGRGRVPAGVDVSDTSFNTVEKTGGSQTSSNSVSIPLPAATGSTTLSTNQIPAHSHTYKTSSDTVPSGSGGYNITSSANVRLGSITSSDTGGGQGHTHPLGGSISASVSTSTLQPYITCYMWKRTV
jgi:microcystin-dependent protein